MQFVMVFIRGVKYACERCIRGHRVTSCKHTDQPLVMIKPKGRPATQCEHCREARKKKVLHIKCTCGAPKNSKDHTEGCPCATNPSKCTCGKTRAKANKPVIVNLGAAGSLLADSSVNKGITKYGPKHGNDPFPIPFGEDIIQNPLLNSAQGLNVYDLGHSHDGGMSIGSLSSGHSSGTVASESVSPASTSSQFDIPLESATSTFIPFSLSGHPAVNQSKPVARPHVANSHHVEHQHQHQHQLYKQHPHQPVNAYNNNQVSSWGGSSSSSGWQDHAFYDQPSPIPNNTATLPSTGVQHGMERSSEPISYSSSYDSWNQTANPSSQGWTSSNMFSGSNPRVNYNQVNPWESFVLGSLEI